MRVSLNSLTHRWSLCPSLLLSPFPPSSFHLCSEGRSAVTQGCHVQKKLPSNNIEGCRAAVYSPPAHLMCPLPPSLLLSSPVVEMEWDGWMDGGGGGAASGSLVNLDNRYRINWEKVERGKERRRGGGRGVVTFKRCCVGLLPASCYSCLPLSRRNWPFPLQLPLYITKRETCAPTACCYQLD